MPSICGYVSGANLPPSANFFVENVLSIWSTKQTLFLVYRRPGASWAESLALTFPYSADLRLVDAG